MSSVIKLKLLIPWKLSHDTSGRAFVGKSISLIAVLEENRKPWTSLSKKQTHICPSAIVSWKPQLLRLAKQYLHIDYRLIKIQYTCAWLIIHVAPTCRRKQRPTLKGSFMQLSNSFRK